MISTRYIRLLRVSSNAAPFIHASGRVVIARSLRLSCYSPLDVPGLRIPLSCTIHPTAFKLSSKRSPHHFRYPSLGVQAAYHRFASSCTFLSPIPTSDPCRPRCHTSPPCSMRMPSDLLLYIQRGVYVRNALLLSRTAPPTICWYLPFLVRLHSTTYLHDLSALPPLVATPIVAIPVPWGRPRPCASTPCCMCLAPFVPFLLYHHRRHVLLLLPQSTHLYLPAYHTLAHRYHLIPLCTVVYGIVRVYLQILLIPNYHSFMRMRAYTCYRTSPSLLRISHRA